METNNNPLRPIGPLPNTDIIGPEPEKEVKKFEAAKGNANADRSKEDNVPNGGSQFRGPLEGGATGGSPSPRADKATGLDGGGVFCRGTFDFGPKGFKATVQCGATAHTDWMPGKGVGPGVKDGKPGVATGDGKGGSVTTPGDASNKAGASSSASPGKSGAPEGLDWTDDKHRIKDSVKALKRDIPAAPPRPDYNDLGPSTNEPEQKADDTTVARNDDARFGDDLAQRI
jgi:hypothetical protein